MTTRSSVRRIQVDDRPLVAKSAAGARRGLLRREAELCTCLEGAGVVRIVALRESDDRTDLVTEAAGDHDLSSYESMDPTTLRRALVTSVAAVERLHEFGWTHGAVCAEHLVVDRAGTATLCSLGSARPLDTATAAADAEQLRRVILHTIERPPRSWSREERLRWRRWTRSVRRAIDRRSGAGTDGAGSNCAGSMAAGADVAIDLASLRTALVTSDVRGHRRRLPDSRRARTVASTGVVVVLIAGAAAVLRQSEVSASRAPSADTAAPLADDRTVTDLTADGPTTVAAASTGAGCSGPAPSGPSTPSTPWTLDMDGNGCGDSVEVVGNLVQVDDATFRVGDPGDVLALGDWDCDGLATVLLLQPSSGEVFHFSWAATGRPTTGQLLTVVDGATSLSSEADDDGCDRAAVQRTVGPALAVPVEPNASRRGGQHHDTALAADTESPQVPDDSRPPDNPDRPDGPGIASRPDGGPP